MVNAVGLTTPLKLSPSGLLSMTEAVIAHSPTPEIHWSLPSKVVKFGP
jgi:hypothetical protein